MTENQISIFERSRDTKICDVMKKVIADEKSALPLQVEIIFFKLE